MKIKDINHMTPSVSSHNMIKESDESESNEGIWYDFDNVEDFIDSVDVKKFAYDITNHASFSEALNDYTVNDYENNEFGERTISWTLPDSGIDLAIRFDFPTFTDLTDFANSNYTKEDFMSHVEDVWSITDPNSNYNDFWSDMDELLSPSDYGYSEYTTDNDYDVNVSPTSIKFNNDGLCIDNDFHILEKVSTDLNFVKIPNDIALIKCFAFDGCSKLTDIVITGHIKYIDRFAFAGAVNLKNVYYVGSKKDWHKIKIGRDNENLTNANIHYNYKGSSNESLNGGTDMKIEESKSIKESLNEASYGGAYDIADDEYFTKEELVEFGEDAVDCMNAVSYSKAKLESIFIENNVIKITISWNENEVTVEQLVDMRRISTPKDLEKYRIPVISKMKHELKKLGFDFGPHPLQDESLNESSDYELARPNSVKLMSYINRGLINPEDTLSNLIDYLSDSEVGEFLDYIVGEYDLNESLNESMSDEEFKNQLIDDLTKQFFSREEAVKLVDKDINWAENLAYGNATPEDFIEAEEWLANN